MTRGPRTAPSLIAALSGAAITAVSTVLAWITSQGSSWTAYDGRLPWAWIGGDIGSQGAGHGAVLLALALLAIITILVSQLRPGIGLGRLSAAIGGVVVALVLADLASFSKLLGPGFKVTDILGPGPAVATVGGLMLFFGGRRLDRAVIGDVRSRSEGTPGRHVNPPGHRLDPIPPARPGATSPQAVPPERQPWWDSP